MPRREVGDPDGGVGLVHLLAARAGGAVRVDAHVRLLHVDDDVVVDLRRHVHRGEARLAARRRVERADPHEAVDALLRLHEAVGVLAARDERGGADAGLLPRGQVGRLDRPALPLAVARVHPVEHRGPVHRLDAARAALHLDDRAGPVVRPGQHLLELERGEVARGRLDVGGGLGAGRLVARLLGELRERLRVLEGAADLLVRARDLLELRLLLQERLGLRVVRPEGRRLGHAGDLVDPSALAVDVKATPGAPRGGASARRGVPASVRPWRQVSVRSAGRRRPARTAAPSAPRVAAAHAQAKRSPNLV